MAKAGATPPLNLQAIVDANKITSPDHFVDFFASFLYDGTLDSDRRAQLINYLTTSDNGRRASQITLSGGQSYPLNRVRGTLYLMMAAPEYHLN